MRSLCWSACAAGLLLLSACRNTPGAASEEVAARRQSPFGIHGPTYAHWLAANDPNLWLEGEARLEVLKAAGAGWARQDFWWGLVEPEQDHFVWDDFDRAIDAYNRHGINLMVILCYGSNWSRGSAPTTDQERANFADYVYRMVDRYQDRVAAWEIWNEPNIQPYWTPRPDPELYTKLLRAAYRAAKRADPDCVVVGGALAGPDEKFLEGMYQAGCKGCFDVFSYHNYGQQNEITTEWPAVEKLRAVMAEYGDADTPIWHTETGFYTGPVGLSEREQAGRIVRYSVGLLALGIQRMFQLTLSDWTDDPNHHDLSVYRGLTHADYTTKLSYAAYRTMCARLGDKRFVAAIRPAPGVSGFLFDSADENVLVVWRDAPGEPSPVSLDLGLPVVLFQLMDGDWRIQRSADGRYQVPLGRDPLYVLNPGEQIRRQRHVVWPNPVLTRIPRAADAVLEATVTNPTDRPLRLRLAPSMLSSACYEGPFVAPGETAEVDVKFNASQLAVGEHEFMWQLAGDAGPVFAEGFRRVEVQSPLRLSFAPLSELDPQQPQLPVCISSSSGRATPGKLALRLAGHPVAEPQQIELPARGERTCGLPLDLQRFEARTAVPISVELEALGLQLQLDSSKLLIACPRAPQDARIDGEIEEWRGRDPQIRPDMMRWEYVNSQEPPAAGDLAVTGWVAYDQRGLWIAVEARDDQVSFPRSRAVWNWDSLQVGLDLAGDAQPDQGYDDNDLEIELGHRAGQPDWCYLGACPPGWPQDALSAKLSGVVRQHKPDGTVVYELLIPAELLVSVTSLAPDTVIGFSILVNDNDGSGRAGWLELTPGIGIGKRPADFAWLWFR